MAFPEVTSVFLVNCHIQGLFSAQNVYDYSAACDALGHVLILKTSLTCQTPLTLLVLL